jgi:hypothetical protein
VTFPAFKLLIDYNPPGSKRLNQQAVAQASVTYGEVLLA